jgi:hypothetical protein
MKNKSTLIQYVCISYVGNMVRFMVCAITVVEKQTAFDSYAGVIVLANKIKIKIFT